MKGIRAIGLEFDRTCATLSIGGRFVPAISISYADGRDGVLVVRASVARAHGLLRHDLPTVAVVTYSHPDVGSDSDMIQGFRIIGAEASVDAPTERERWEVRAVNRWAMKGDRDMGCSDTSYASASNWPARMMSKARRWIIDIAREILGIASSVEQESDAEIATRNIDPALTIALRFGYDRILWTDRRRCLHNPAKPRPAPPDPRKTIVDLHAVSISSVTEEQVREIMRKMTEEEGAS